MKPVLLFTCLALLTSSLTCCHFGDNDIAPIFTKEGMWQARNIETTKYGPNNQVVDQNSRILNNGDMAIEFNEEKAIFNEYENGALIKSGNYVNGDQPEKLVLISGTDSLEMQIVSMSASQLVLQSQEVDANGQSVQVINYER